jgi:N utilization substance protein B
MQGKKVGQFFHYLVDGVGEHRETIDAVIERFSSNWRISRMTCVDRNVLRIAAFELLYCADIPPKVSINEAIDVAKRFGTEESGAFINGILDSIRIAMQNNDVEHVPKTIERE